MASRKASYAPKLGIRRWLAVLTARGEWLTGISWVTVAAYWACSTEALCTECRTRRTARRGTRQSCGHGWPLFWKPIQGGSTSFEREAAVKSVRRTAKPRPAGVYYPRLVQAPRWSLHSKGGAGAQSRHAYCGHVLERRSGNGIDGVFLLLLALPLEGAPKDGSIHTPPRPEDEGAAATGENTEGSFGLSPDTVCGFMTARRRAGTRRGFAEVERTCSR